MLTVLDLQKRYVTNEAEVHALSDITLDDRDGEFVSLLGPSGCGKSTLLKIAAGLIGATRGKIEIDGAMVEGPGTRACCRVPGLCPFSLDDCRRQRRVRLEARGMPAAPDARSRRSC